MGRFRAYTSSDFSATHTLTSSALRPHFHSGYVIGYLFSGRYHCRLSQKQHFEFRPGEITLLHPGEVHQDYSSNQDRDYLTVNIQEHVFPNELRASGASNGVLPSFLRPMIKADLQTELIFGDLRRALDGHESDRQFRIRMLVIKLAEYLSHHFASPHYPPDRPFRERETTRWEIRRARELLHDSYADAFDLDQFARSVGLSKYYLEKIFKKSTGLSPYQYLMQLRVERAKCLLASSPKTLIEIAMDLGFFDQSHFTNAFRKFTGTSPLSYRLATQY